MKTPPKLQHFLRSLALVAAAVISLSACAESTESPSVTSAEETTLVRSSEQALGCGADSGVPCTAGLHGAYFDNNDFTDLVLFRIDPTIDFRWAGGRPAPELGSNNFSVQWSGYLTPDVAGDYVFSVWSDDGLELLLDGQEAVSDLVIGTGHGARYVHGDPVTLEARPYRFFARAVEYGGHANARLLMRDANTPTTDADLQPVPASWLSQEGAGEGMRREIYTDGDALRGGAPAVHVTTIDALSFDFSDSLDHAPNGFVNRVTGTFFAPYPGLYTFRLTCDSAASLSIDGINTQTIDRLAATAPIDEMMTVAIEMGDSAGFRLEVYDDTWNAGSDCEVSWQNDYASGTPDADGFFSLADTRFEPATLGRGEGIEGQYFDNQDFTNRLGVQTDEQIDFNWGSSGPILNSGVVLGSDRFSIRWTGQIQATVTDDVTFHTQADNYLSFWMASNFVPRAGSASCGADADCGWDSLCEAAVCQDPVYTQIISNGGTRSVTVPMVEGQFYPIRMDFEEVTGNARMSLEWASTSTPREVIPAAQLYGPVRGNSDGQGLEAHYFDYRSTSPPSLEFDRVSSNAAFTRTDPDINFNWGYASPSPETGFPANDFMVRWMGQVRARYTEEYTLRVFHNNGVRLWIDEELVLDYWNAGNAESVVTVDLIAGKRHDIVLQMNERTASARTRLLWSSNSQLEEAIPQQRLFLPPRLGAGTGLLAEYFGDEELSETALRLIRIDPTMSFDYADGPAAALSFPGHSAAWSGEFEPLYDETYTITVRANGGARLYLGDVLVAENWSDSGDILVDVSADIEVTEEQLYAIRVEYFQTQLDGQVELLWASPSQVESVIPTRQLYPSDPEERVAFGQCDAVLAIETFDDGSGLPAGLQDTGGLQLTSTVQTRPDLWAANTNDQTVTRINTATGQVLGTYPAGLQASRTAVDLDYNAWVANRAMGSDQMGTINKLISVHSDGTPCVCCDGEVVGGVCDDYDPLSICNECLAYSVDLGEETIPRALAVDADNNVWVGLFRTEELVHVRNCEVDPNSTPGNWTIDPECATPRCGPGDALCIARAVEIGNDCSAALPNDDCRGDMIIARYDLPSDINPYGMAIDTEGYIWIADLDHIACFDPRTGELCGRYRTEWARSFQAAGETGCDRPYGISLDGAGNVWWGQWTCGGLGYLDRAVWETARQDNSDQSGTIWANVEAVVNYVGTYRFQDPNDDKTRGVAVDGNGVVWVASSGTNRMLRFDPSMPTPQWRADAHSACIEECTTNRRRPDGSAIGAGDELIQCTNYCGPAVQGDFTGSFETCSNPIGVGISDDGDAWGVCYSSRRAQAFRDDGSIRFEADTGSGPYSYSDMTGFQLRNFTAPQGQWSRVFDCTTDGGRVDESGRCVFDYLSWDSLTPEGTRVVVEVRAGDEDAGGQIVWGPWSAENEVTPAPLSGDGYQGRYVEVRVTLFASTRGETPILFGVDLWQCPRLGPPVDFAVDELTIISQGATPNYTLSWAFTDDSWPEEYFEMVDENGNVRCTVLSESSITQGERYDGNDPLPSCLETGLTSNTPQTRSPRTVNSYAGEILRSHLGEELTIYTLVNDPQANFDMRFMGRESESITVNWCNPRQNWTAGLTGASIERSTTPAFSVTDLDYAVISDFPTDATATIGERGYASPTSLCGNHLDEGLSPGTMYYYRLTFQNGDGVDSVPLVMAHETAGALCCEVIGNCVGVCGDSEQSSDLECTLPPTFEDPETTCDGLDNDCDGDVDEGLLNACGSCGTVPPETCDGFDNDCSGTVDDNPIDGNFYYADTDLDGFGDPNERITACIRPPGYVVDNTDCDDSRDNVYPGAEEVCDGLDNDCDGGVDEDLGGDYYPDADNDGFGDDDNVYSGCLPPGDHIEDGGDCDDTRGDVNPNAEEICDDIDNDCDGFIDENFIELGVVIDAFQSVTDVGVAACDNDYAEDECGSAVAITVTITNTGTTDVSEDAEFRVNIDSAGGDVVFPAESIGAPLSGGEDMTLTFCFTHDFEVDAADGRDLYATVGPPAGLSCGEVSDTLDDVELRTIAEICDGIDNDCNEGVDESPEACGSPLFTCVENSGSTGDAYLCVITLETEAAESDGDCEANGTCGEVCQADEDCGEDAQCHLGQCVALADIEAAIEEGPTAPAAEEVYDATPEEFAAADDVRSATGMNNNAQAGCSASVVPAAGAGWAGCLFLLTWVRSRRCRAAVSPSLNRKPALARVLASPAPPGETREFFEEAQTRALGLVPALQEGRLRE